MKSFSVNEWVGLILSVCTLSAGITAYSYSEFVLKEGYKDDKAEILRRLERIEAKLDALSDRR